MDPMNPVSPDLVRVFARLVIHCTINEGSNRLTTAKRMATRRREDWWARQDYKFKREFWEKHFDETLPQYKDQIPDLIPELTWHVLGDVRDALIAAAVPYQDYNRPMTLTPHQAAQWLNLLEGALAKLQQVPEGFNLGLNAPGDGPQTPNAQTWTGPATSATTP